MAATLSPAVHSSVQLGFKDMTLSHEAFGVCIAMASLRVYCLLLLMHVLDFVRSYKSCSVCATSDCSVCVRMCVHVRLQLCACT